MLTCTSPYLKSKNVQMKKKARFYLGFRICTNVQVKLLFLGFHLYIPSSLVHVCKCRKPHKHWVFRSLVHFLISSRGVPPLSLRALGRRLMPRLIERIVHVRAGGFAEIFPPLRDAKRRHGQSGHGPRASELTARLLPGRPQRPSRDLASPATDYSAMTVTNRAFTSPPQRWPWGTVGLK